MWHIFSTYEHVAFLECNGIFWRIDVLKLQNVACLSIVYLFSSVKLLCPHNWIVLPSLSVCYSYFEIIFCICGESIMSSRHNNIAKKNYIKQLLQSADASLCLVFVLIDFFPRFLFMLFDISTLIIIVQIDIRELFSINTLHIYLW